MPICPAMRRPFTTRWNAVLPMEPGARQRFFCPCVFGTSRETMPLHDALESAALREPAHANLVAFLKIGDRHRIAHVEFRRSPQDAPENS